MMAAIMLGLFFALAMAKFGSELTFTDLLWLAGSLVLVIGGFVAWFRISTRTYWRLINFAGRRIVGPAFLLIGLVLMTLSLNAGLSDVRTDTDRGFSWFEFTLGASVAILGGLMVVAAPYVPKDPASIETEASRVVRDHDPS